MTLHAGDAVVAIDRRRRLVKSQPRRASSTYDRLLFATGSKPIMLPVPGDDLPGVITFRDLADVDAMLQRRRSRAPRGRHRRRPAGAGSRQRPAVSAGMDVTVVHLLRHADGAAARSGRRRAAASVAREPRHRSSRCRRRPRDRAGTDRVTGVRFEDGSEIPADLVVMAAGVRPNIDAGARQPACDATAACSSTTRCRRTTRASTPSANACSTATSRSAWSRRCGSRRACARRISRSSASSRYRGVAARHAAEGHRASISTPPATSSAASASEDIVLRDPGAASTSASSSATTSCAAPCCSATRSAGPWYFEHDQRRAATSAACATRCCSVPRRRDHDGSRYARPARTAASVAACSRAARRHGVEIAGDPRASGERGRLCSKGSALGETLGLEGRLLHPSIARPARELG